MKYANPPLILDDVSIKDTLGTLHYSALPDPQPDHPMRLKGASPLIERLWRVALSDIESNIVTFEGKAFFSAGKHFKLKEFTRDLALSGVLGLNRLYPDIMRSSLEYTRHVRLTIGATCSSDHPLGDIPVKTHPLPEHEFSAKYFNAGSITRRTDDVVWLWAAGDLADKTGRKSDWEWIYEKGLECFRVLYDPFYDSSDGLFHGQACFVDVTYTEPLRPAFVSEKVTGYPLHFAASDCAHVKALSTNSLYYQAMKVMEKAAHIHGHEKEAFHWRTRAECLKLAVRKGLRKSDGTFAYYKGPDNKLAERRDALGPALAVLFDIVTGDEALAALSGYPITDAGLPLFHPFFPGNHFYHNNSAWPFVDTLFLKALEKCSKESHTAQNFALLARTCNTKGTFFEVVDFRDKTLTGSPRQLWTAAAFVDVCGRAGLCH